MSRALGYARAALDHAKTSQDREHYLYLCRNLGLLGVLIQPTDVLDVLAHVLTQLKATGKEGLAFSEETKAEIREVVVESLANIRVLYRKEIDGYLLDALDDSRLYAEVDDKDAAVRAGRLLQLGLRAACSSRCSRDITIRSDGPLSRLCARGWNRRPPWTR